MNTELLATTTPSAPAIQHSHSSPCSARTAFHGWFTPAPPAHNSATHTHTHTNRLMALSPVSDAVFRELRCAPSAPSLAIKRRLTFNHPFSESRCDDWNPPIFSILSHVLFLAVIIAALTEPVVNEIVVS